MRYFLGLTLLYICATAHSQDLAIGQWRSHLPYTFAVSVTQSDEAIYFAGKESLFSLNKNDNSIERFNKVTGLSDAGIQKIRFNTTNDRLLIAYTNSNIDLMDTNGRVINISAIKDEGITGDSKIYHIFFQDEFAWLSTGFGLTKLDMNKEEFRFTTFTNITINSTTIYGDYLYASTEDGIYRILLNTTELYQANFANWEKIDENLGLPNAYYSNVNTVFDGKLYADVNDTLYVYDDEAWSSFYYENDFSWKTLYAGNYRLVASLERSTGVDKVFIIQADSATYSITNNDFVGKSAEAIEDENSLIWIADEFRGMSSFSTFSGVGQAYEVNGPYSSNIGEITVHDGEVWVAGISVQPLWQYRYLSDGFFHYANNTWTNYHTPDYPELFDNNYLDMVSIKVRPSDERVFIASYFGGLVEFDGTDFTTYNEDNSTLQRPIADTFSLRVAGLAFDRDDNLWMSNYAAEKPIAVLEPDGTWHSYKPTVSFPFPTQILVDFNGYKWFAGGEAAQGLMVYDDGGTLDITSDDRYLNINQNNSELPSDLVTCLEMDLDGNIWVGTNLGITVFECAGQIFDNGCAGRKPIFDESEEEEYLFKDIRINSIAIDGGNRKWIGTSTTGLFVLDADVERTEAEFNTSNSPIFSNEIIDIAIDGTSGEAYVGTSGGLLSYRAEATDGQDFFREVYAFPNPVRPEYTGTIAIKGLTTDANIKITDISGTLLYETTALGGQAVWDGNDYNGRRAASGVYLVYMTRKDGLESMVTKILVIN